MSTEPSPYRHNASVEPTQNLRNLRPNKRRLSLGSTPIGDRVGMSTSPVYLDVARVRLSLLNVRIIVLVLVAARPEFSFRFVPTTTPYTQETVQSTEYVVTALPLLHVRRGRAVHKDQSPSRLRPAIDRSISAWCLMPTRRRTSSLLSSLPVMAGRELRSTEYAMRTSLDRRPWTHHVDSG